MWVGDELEFIRTLIDTFYYRIYVNTSNPTHKAINSYKTTVKNIMDNFSDVKNIKIMVVDELKDYFNSEVGGVLIEMFDVLKGMNREAVSREMMRVGKRVNKRVGIPETYVSSACIVVEGGKIVDIKFGQNTHDVGGELEKYVPLLKKYYSRQIHSEAISIIRCIDEGLFVEDRDYYLVVLRNGGGVPSRPCPKCRRFINDNVPKNVNFYIVYPIVGDIVGVEKYF